MAGCTAGQFVYSAIGSITLPARASYYLVSQETQGGDRWYDQGAISTANVATVNSSVYFYNGSWYPIGGGNTSYAPPNFQYLTATPPQYALTTGVSSVASGTIVANPTPVGGVYNSGTPVQLTATPASGCAFVSWSGALTGTANPQTVTMSGPQTVTANFQCAAPPPPLACTAPVLSLAQQQVSKTMTYITASQFPEATNPGNSNHWNAGPATDWTSGFYPGLLWYMYEQTLDSSFLTRAKAQTANLIGETTDASGHDVGFRILSTHPI